MTAVEPSPAIDMRCAECGYDLRGQPELVRCPECGLVADDPAEHEAVVEWYCSWRGWLLLRVPPRFVRHLGDPRCRAYARRRAFFYVFAPWLISTLLLIGLDSVQVIKTVRVWWEVPSRPDVYISDETDHADGLLRFKLHFDALFLNIPLDAKEKTEVIGRTWRLTIPLVEGFAWMLWIPLPSFVVLGAAVNWFVLQIAHRLDRTAGQHFLPALELSLAALAPWYLSFIMLHLAAAAAYAQRVISEFEPWAMVVVVLWPASAALLGLVASRVPILLWNGSAVVWRRARSLLVVLVCLAGWVALHVGAFALLVAVTR